MKAIRLIVALPVLALAVGQLHAAQATDPVPLPTAKPAALKPANPKAPQSKAAQSKTAQSKAAQSKPAEKKAQAHKAAAAPISLNSASAAWSGDCVQSCCTNSRQCRSWPVAGTAGAGAVTA